MRKKTPEEFEREVFSKVGNEYSVLSKYDTTHSPVTMKHNKCGLIFPVMPSNFLRGSRCPKCSVKIISDKSRKTIDEFKQEVYDKVGNEYEVLGEYVNANTKVKFKHIKCRETFFMTPSHFLAGQRCTNPTCKKHRVDSARILKKSEEFEAYVEDIKNGEYILLGDYVDQFTKIEILHTPCKNQYFITPKEFKAGRQRCSICKKKDELKEKDKNFKEYVFKHGKGDYEVVDIYKGNSKKIKILHNKCGKVYETTPSSFKTGNRCTHCSEKRKWTTEEFKEYVMEKEGEDYFVVGDYINSQTKIEIKHNKCGTIYPVAPTDFKSGNRCPRCTSSKGEKAISTFLNKHNVEYQHNKSYSDACLFKTSLRFDFLIYDNEGNLKLICEFDGIQHFEPVNMFGGEKGFKETQERDKIKNKFCKDNGIPLLRIPYWEINNIHRILGKKLYKLGLI